MALYALGDPHLSFSAKKPMDVFGGNWVGYVEKLRQGLQCVTKEDTILFCGDLSWGMSLEEAAEDLAFLNRVPGRKILLKGNHDYWWQTARKMRQFFQERGFQFELLHNNCLLYGDIALCGTRGWFLDEDKGAQNEKLRRREALRLEASLRAAGAREKLCFLHYPPIYQGYRCPELLTLLKEHGVRRCFFGHLHGASCRLAVEGSVDGTEFTLISADHLNFIPKKIL